MDWLKAVARLRGEGESGVMITVIDVRGHAPRDAGAKLVVAEARTWGSVGGGNLEQTAVDRARQMLIQGASSPETLEVRLNEHVRADHGRQCCGGVVRLLLEPLPARPAIAVFGVGHVGYELARILSRLEVALHLIDSRSDQLDPLRLADITDGVADVTVHHALVGETVLGRLPRGATVLIMTHDHAEDFALCDAALRSDRPGRIGLIGSAAKWSRFRRLLAAQGHDKTTLDRITSPIGSPAVVGKDPAVIAVSVAADLLSDHSGRPAPTRTGAGG